MFRHFGALYNSAIRTGQMSNETKVGKLAKLFRCEVLGKKQMFDFMAFGENPIGRAAKAISIAQESRFDDQGADVPSDMKIIFSPYNYDSPEKQRGDVPSIRFIINSGQRKYDATPRRIMNVASLTDPEELAKRIHREYMANQSFFSLRCLGDRQSSIAVRSIAIFNDNVESHKLVSWMSTERVPDSRSRDNSQELLAMIFNIDVVKAGEALQPASREFVRRD